MTHVPAEFMSLTDYLHEAASALERAAKTLAGADRPNAARWARRAALRASEAALRGMFDPSFPRSEAAKDLDRDIDKGPRPQDPDER